MITRTATLTAIAALSFAAVPAAASAQPPPTDRQATRAIVHSWRRARRPVTVYGCRRRHAVTRCMSKVVFVAYLDNTRGTAAVFTTEAVRWRDGRLTVHDGSSVAVLSFP